MKPVTQHNFATLPPPRNPRSTFNRSCANKTTIGHKYLYPVFIDEILPGDTVNMRATFFARLATLLHPVMDNLYLDMFFFWCPSRLLWDNFERFIGSSPTQDKPTEYEIPSLVAFEGSTPVPVEFATASLGDYFGLPTLVSIAVADAPSALPWRMYNKVMNEWFLIPDLQDELLVETGDGPDDVLDYNLFARNKRHDYFTSCLPWPQRGDAVPISIGSSAPVVGDGQGLGLLSDIDTYLTFTDNTGTNGLFQARTANGVVGVSIMAGSVPSFDRYTGLHTDPDKSHVYADLSLAEGLTINQLREAFAFQHVLERDARSGTRYVEYLKGTWGVVAPDFRLQRTEFIASHSQMMQVRAVPQTSETLDASNTPQANLAAYTTVGSQMKFNKSFVEHGYLMGLANIRTDLTYQQGMERMWSRKTRFEFAHPDLMHLGEQEVLTKEIFYADTGTGANTVFGYQERYAEYRYKPSRVTGSFRSNFAESLDTWHFALDFASAPELNETFLEDNPPIDRALAVNDTPQRDFVIFDSFYDYKHSRIMPVYGVPGLDLL